ncbi:MAG: sensor histidine kinase [Saprospiraceae bacterium]|nr:sensor histidine kinase [Saprospiraceae bacterium]
MEIVIKLPSLEEQRRKVNNVFQEILFKEKDKIAFIRKVFNEELGVKQHNIRQHLKNVKDSLDTLIDYMEKKGGILNKEDVINPNRNVTVGKRFDKMYASLENVIEEINTLTNEQSFSLSEPIDLIQLITASVDEIIHPNFDVALTKDEVGILGTELDKLIITFSAKDLKELINNVVENAVRHGFTDKDKFYKIVFDISVDEETAILTIKNNGAPFPKNISSHIGVKGKKQENMLIRVLGRGK